MPKDICEAETTSNSEKEPVVLLLLSYICLKVLVSICMLVNVSQSVENSTK